MTATEPTLNELYAGLDDTGRAWIEAHYANRPPGTARVRAESIGRTLYATARLRAMTEYERELRRARDIPQLPAGAFAAQRPTAGEAFWSRETDR